jgi:DNA repair exonuclease SbcCD ATPase subunit
LEESKQIIERVDTQNHQVEEAVSNIEEKVRQFSEESQMIESSDESVKQLEAMLGVLTRDLERASHEREKLEEKSGDLFGEVTSALDNLREQINRSEILREDIDVANGRVEALFQQLRDQEDLAKMVEARGEELIAASLETKELISKAANLGARFDGFEEQMHRVESLETRLDNLGEIGRKVDQQIDSLDERQELVQSTEQRLGKMSAVFSEIKERLTDLDSQRQELDQTLQLFGEFRNSTVEIRGRIQELDGDFERVNDVEQRLEELRRLVENLEGTIVDLEPRIEFVQGIESRLNHLDTLSQMVDGRIESQLATQSDLDSMRHSQEGLSQQLDDLKKLATTLQNSPKLATMEQRLTEFEDRLQVSNRRLERMETLEKSLIENERRLESVAQGLHESQSSLDSHSARLEALSSQSAEAKEVFSGWMDGVTQLEARQRELAEQAENTDGRLREVRDLHDKLEDDIDVLAEREKQFDRHAQELQAFEGRLQDLDRKVAAVNSRHAIVDRVKKDVQKVFDTVDQSREQATEVLNARQEITAVGETVTDVASQVQKLEKRIDGVQDQLGVVESAEVKIDALNHIVNDIDVNLEHFEGQKAMIQHLAEKISKLDVLVQHAEVTARELREERQLAFRIQKTIKPSGGNGSKGPVALTVVETDEHIEAEVERESSQSV